jgi:HlyD family secretion protein
VQSATEYDPASLVETLPRKLPDEDSPISASPVNTSVTTFRETYDGSITEQVRPRHYGARWLIVAMLVISVTAGLYAWRRLTPAPLPPGFAVSNGRLEARQVDIATKLAGRIEAVLAREGDFVEAGQIIARMDTNTLRAQLLEMRADVARARTAVDTSAAVVEQRRSELELAGRTLKRSQELVKGGFISSEKLDADSAQMKVASAALAAAQSKVVESKSAVTAANATVARIQADIDDSILRAPSAGRVQYRLAEPGEVLAAGGRVVDMLNLTDVYMTVFLPEALAGKLVIGADARLVLDAEPQYVIPAQVTFVATEAQFTPKTVETASERDKLVFRVKAQIAPEVLRTYWARVKSGVPGVAYVRIDPTAPWPQKLAVGMPP